MSAVLVGIAGISTRAEAQNYPWRAHRRDRIKSCSTQHFPMVSKDRLSRMRLILLTS
jgi:hypothetical protein